MTLALPCLVGFTLLLCGAVAALPEALKLQTPRPYNQGAGPMEASVWVVQGPNGHWFVNGEPVARSALSARLGGRKAAADLHFLPSKAIPMGEVSSSLAWLRSLGGHHVVLELPPENP